MKIEIQARKKGIETKEEGPYVESGDYRRIANSLEKICGVTKVGGLRSGLIRFPTCAGWVIEGDNYNTTEVHRIITEGDYDIMSEMETDHPQGRSY